MLTINLDIFSGRPNPKWQLSKEEVKQLVDRVTADPSLLLPFDADTGGLGYRGFIIEVTGPEEDDDWKKANLPQLARIGGKRTPIGAVEPSNWLLHTAMQTHSDAHDDILQMATDAIHTSHRDKHLAVPLAAYTPCANSY